MNRLAAIASIVALLCAASAAQEVASVERWTCDADELIPHPLEVRRGESRVFEVTFETNDVAMGLSRATGARMYYTPADPSTNTTHYTITGSVHNASAGKVRVHWDSGDEATPDYYEYEIAVLGTTQTMVRAFGPLTLKPGIGDAGSISGTPSARETFDYAAVDIQNADLAPWATEAFVDVKRQTATNEAAGLAQGYTGTVMTAVAGLYAAQSDTNAIRIAATNQAAGLAQGYTGTVMTAVAGLYAAQSDTNAIRTAATNEAAGLAQGYTGTVMTAVAGLYAAQSDTNAIRTAATNQAAGLAQGYTGTVMTAVAGIYAAQSDTNAIRTAATNQAAGLAQGYTGTVMTAVAGLYAAQSDTNAIRTAATNEAAGLAQGYTGTVMTAVAGLYAAQSDTNAIRTAATNEAAGLAQGYTGTVMTAVAGLYAAQSDTNAIRTAATNQAATSAAALYAAQSDTNAIRVAATNEAAGLFAATYVAQSDTNAIRLAATNQAAGLAQGYTGTVMTAVAGLYAAQSDTNAIRIAATNQAAGSAAALYAAQSDTNAIRVAATNQAATSAAALYAAQSDTNAIRIAATNQAATSSAALYAAQSDTNAIRVAATNQAATSAAALYAAQSDTNAIRQAATNQSIAWVVDKGADGTLKDGSTVEDGLITAFGTENITNIMDQLKVADSSSLGSELLSNGGFTNAWGWYLSNCTHQAAGTYADKIRIDAGQTAMIQVSNAAAPSIVTGATYYLSVYLHSFGDSVTYSARMGGFTNSATATSAGTIARVHPVRNQDRLQLWITAGYTYAVYLDNASLKQITGGDTWMADEAFVGGDLYIKGTNILDRIESYTDTATGALATVAHTGDHGDLTGLSDDDHPQYTTHGEATNIADQAAAAATNGITGKYVDESGDDMTGDLGGGLNSLTNWGDIYLLGGATPGIGRIYFVRVHDVGTATHSGEGGMTLAALEGALGDPASVTNSGVESVAIAYLFSGGVQDVSGNASLGLAYGTGSQTLSHNAAIALGPTNSQADYSVTAPGGFYGPGGNLSGVVTSESDPQWAAWTNSESVALGQNASVTPGAAHDVAIGKYAVASASSVAVGEGSIAHDESVAVGRLAEAYTGAGPPLYAVAVGYGAKANVEKGTAIGGNTSVTMTNAAALGQGAGSAANYAVQLGLGTNATTDSLQFREQVVMDASRNLRGQGLQLGTGATATNINTTVTDDDEQVPTSGAVVDYVAANGGVWTAAGDDTISYTNGNVSIGTTNAQAKLHVNVTDGTAPLTVSSNDTDHLRVMPNGLVRVGDGGSAGTATGPGELYVEHDIESDGNIYGGIILGSTRLRSNYIFDAGGQQARIELLSGQYIKMSSSTTERVRFDLTTGAIALSGTSSQDVSVAGSAGIVAFTNTGVAELHAWDSEGNYTKLSAHDGAVAVSRSWNIYTGEGREINEDAQGIFLQALYEGNNWQKSRAKVLSAGHDYIYRPIKRPPVDWDAKQNRLTAERQAAIVAWQSDTNSVDIKGEPPEPYKRPLKPSWLKRWEANQ